jgi:hypothetical protein
LLTTFFAPNRILSNLFTFFPLWLLAALWAYVLWYDPYSLSRKIIRGPTSLARTVEITEEGIHSRSTSTDSRLTWEAIIDWAEVERVFTLFVTSVSFFPIPKRAMTEEQQNEFRALLKARVAPK